MAESLPVGPFWIQSWPSLWSGVSRAARFFSQVNFAERVWTSLRAAQWAMRSLKAESGCEVCATRRSASGIPHLKLRCMQTSGVLKSAGILVGTDAGGDIGVLRFVAEHFDGFGDVGLGVLLEEGVGVFEVVGLEGCAKRFVEAGDDFVEGVRLPAADVEDGGEGRVVDFHGEEVDLDDIFDGDEIALLFAGGEHARASAGFHLLSELIDHAG